MGEEEKEYPSEIELKEDSKKDEVDYFLLGSWREDVLLCENTASFTGFMHFFCSNGWTKLYPVFI